MIITKRKRKGKRLWQVKIGCFGKEKSEQPEIAIAALGNKASMIGSASLI